MKKIVSIALVLALAVATFAVPASAYGYNPNDPQNSVNVYSGSTYMGKLICSISMFCEYDGLGGHNNEEIEVHAVWSGSPLRVAASVEVINNSTGDTLSPYKYVAQSNTTIASAPAYPLHVLNRTYRVYGCAEVFASNFSGLVRHARTEKCTHNP